MDSISLYPIYDKATVQYSEDPLDYICFVCPDDRNLHSRILVDHLSNSDHVEKLRSHIGSNQCVACKVCLKLVPFNEFLNHARSHKFSPWHVPPNIPKVLFKNFISQRFNQYFCNLCNIKLSSWYLATNHSEEAHHQTLKRNRIDEVIFQTLSFSPEHYQLAITNSIFIDSEESLSCILCHCDVGTLYKDIQRHIDDEYHIKNLDIDAETFDSVHSNTEYQGKFLKSEPGNPESIRATTELPEATTEQNSFSRLKDPLDPINVSPVPTSDEQLPGGIVSTVDDNQFTCTLCQKNITGYIDTLKHAQGKTHLRKLRQQGEVLVKSKFETLSKFIIHRVIKYKCSVCNCRLSGMGALPQHVKGLRHRSKIVEQQNVCMTLNLNGSSSDKNSSDVISDLDKSDTNRIIQVISDKYWCTICRYRIDGLESVDNHLEDETHKNKVEENSTSLDQGFHTTVSSLSLSLAALCLNDDDISIPNINITELQDQDEYIVLGEEIFVADCKFCHQEIVGGAEALEIHLNSNKHIKNRLLSVDFSCSLDEAEVPESPEFEENGDIKYFIIKNFGDIPDEVIRIVEIPRGISRPDWKTFYWCKLCNFRSSAGDALDTHLNCSIHRENSGSSAIVTSEGSTGLDNSSEYGECSTVFDSSIVQTGKSPEFTSQPIGLTSLVQGVPDPPADSFKPISAIEITSDSLETLATVNAISKLIDPLDGESLVLGEQIFLTDGKLCHQEILGGAEALESHLKSNKHVKSSQLSVDFSRCSDKTEAPESPELEENGDIKYFIIESSGDISDEIIRIAEIPKGVSRSDWRTFYYCKLCNFRSSARDTLNNHLNDVMHLENSRKPEVPSSPSSTGLHDSSGYEESSLGHDASTVPPHESTPEPMGPHNQMFACHVKELPEDASAHARGKQHVTKAEQWREQEPIKPGKNRLKHLLLKRDGNGLGDWSKPGAGDSSDCSKPELGSRNSSAPLKAAVALNSVSKLPDQSVAALSAKVSRGFSSSDIPRNAVVKYHYIASKVRCIECKICCLKIRSIFGESVYAKYERHKRSAAHNEKETKFVDGWISSHLYSAKLMKKNGKNKREEKGKTKRKKKGKRRVIVVDRIDPCSICGEEFELQKELHNHMTSHLWNRFLGSADVKPEVRAAPAETLFSEAEIDSSDSSSDLTSLEFDDAVTTRREVTVQERFDPKPLDLPPDDDLNIYKIDKGKIKDLQLGLLLSFPIDKDIIFCQICRHRVGSSLQTLYEHLCSANHLTFLRQMIEDHKLFHDHPDEFSDLSLAQEFMQELLGDAVQCYACDVSIKNASVHVRDHIRKTSHKQKWSALGANAGQWLPLLYSRLHGDFYSTQTYCCIPCEQNFSVEAQFRHHLLEKSHKEQIERFRNDHFMFDYCAVCAALWYGFFNTYGYHSTCKMHKYLIVNGHYVLTKLPHSAERLLRAADKIHEILIKMNSRRETERKKEDQLIKELLSIVRVRCPSVKAYPFGSRVSGLGGFHSDLDIFVDCIKKDSVYCGNNSSYKQVLNRMDLVRECLEKHCNNWHINQYVETCRVPIIQLIHRSTGIECDISFNNGLAVESTKMVVTYCERYPNCRKLIIFMKNWMGHCDIGGVNGISSYGVAWLVIYFLQVKEILPTVSELIERRKKSKLIAGWETGVSTDFQPRENAEEFEVLLRQFFRFYGEFDYRNFVICPLVGKSVGKRMFQVPAWLPPSMKLYVEYLKKSDSEKFRIDPIMCLQDPFCLENNITKHVQKMIVYKFRTFCALSAQVLGEGAQGR